MHHPIDLEEGVELGISKDDSVLLNSVLHGPSPRDQGFKREKKKIYLSMPISQGELNAERNDFNGGNMEHIRVRLYGSTVELLIN